MGSVPPMLPLEWVCNCKDQHSPSRLCHFAISYPPFFHIILSKSHDPNYLYIIYIIQYWKYWYAKFSKSLVIWSQFRNNVREMYLARHLIWKLVSFYYTTVYEHHLTFHVFTSYVTSYWLNDVYVGFSHLSVTDVHCICTWVCSLFTDMLDVWGAVMNYWQSLFKSTIQVTLSL